MAEEKGIFEKLKEAFKLKSISDEVWDMVKAGALIIFFGFVVKAVHYGLELVFGSGS